MMRRRRGVPYLMALDGDVIFKGVPSDALICPA